MTNPNNNQKDEIIEEGIKKEIIKIKDDKVIYPNGKSYNFKDPEEKVRARVIIELVVKYLYPIQRLDTEVYPPRREPKLPADIVVYEDDDKEHAFIVVETKAESTEAKINEALREGLGNSNLLNAKFLYCVCGTEELIFDVKTKPALSKLFKSRIQTIPIKYGKIPEYKYKRGDPKWDLQKVNFSELSRIFQRCHNIIWAGGKRDPSVAFDEMSKLIFTKLYDERTTKNNEFYKFQIGTNEDEDIVAERIIKIYEKAQAVNSTVFRESINIPKDKIFGVVDVLQKVSLIHTDLDAKGRAFEQFLGKIFRGELGQYFTRREIVEFAVAMLNPQEDDLILDPACGSGGFLLYSLRKVINDIEQHYSGDYSTINRKKYDFAHYNIYGIEINDKIARVSMMDMIIHDDGHTNIECNTALNNRFENPKIKDGEFSLILTNPPFGDRIEEGDRDKLGTNKLTNFELARGESQKTEILFIERCYNFLKDGGRLGIVLPDGVLNNPSDSYVRDYIKTNFKILAIVTLPDFAFRKAGSGMRTSLLFLEKTNKKQKITDYPLFIAVAEHIGYDATGRPDKNELPEIFKDFMEKQENKDKGRYWLKFSELSDRLDPMYYHLGYLIEKHLKKVKYKIVRLNEILVEPLISGQSPKGGVKYSVGEIPSLVIGNMLDSGELIFDELNYVSADFYEKRKEKLQLKVNDILIAKDGATTGKVCIVMENFPFEDCMFNEHIFRLRIDTAKAHPLYVFHFLYGSLGQMQLKREISGGAQGGITREFVEKIMIPIPPIEIQKEIVKRAISIRKDISELQTKIKEKFSDIEKEMEKIIEK